jgi:hypothetical protein
VREDSIAAGIGYLTGLGLLLVWPDRASANQTLVFVAGMALLVLAGSVVDRVAFMRPPRLRFPQRSSRPARFSTLNFLGMFGALMYTGYLRTSGDPDRGLIGYSVAALLILAGATASNLWWAQAVKPHSGGTFTNAD